MQKLNICMFGNNMDTATNQPSQKLSKLDELDLRDTAGEVSTKS